LSKHRLSFHPTAQRIYTEGLGTIKEFDFDRRDVLREATAGVKAVATSADGKYIASGSDDGVLRIYDAASGNLVRSLTAHDSIIFTLTFSPDSALVASGSADKSVKLWSIPSGSLVRTLTGHQMPVRTVGFTPNGQRIASAGDDRTIRLWNMNNPEQQRVISTASLVCWAAFSPDGRTIAALLGDTGAISIWNANTLEHEGKLEIEIWGSREGMCSPLAFSRDGQLLVGQDPAEQSIGIWNYPKRRLERVVQVFHSTEWISSLALSPDNTRVAIGGERGGSLYVWDLSRGVLLVNLSGHTNGLNSLAWTPDGTRIISGSLDRTVRIWDSRSFIDYEGELAVDKRSDRWRLADEVIQAIENDRTISNEVRRRAVEIAARRGHSPYPDLLVNAWQTGVKPDRSPADYAKALRRVTQVATTAPWFGRSHCILGLLQYRNGEFDKALESEQKAMDIQKAEAHDAHAIRAMAYYRLHAIANAQAELALARNSIHSDPYDEFVAPALLKEAESLLSGKK
jgi:WD40 repeat protein